MQESISTAKTVRNFKLLTIAGCAGTLVFLLLEAWRENFAGEWQSYQAAYAAQLEPELRGAFEVGLKQAFVPALGKVDRCQSCHVGIDDPSMVDAEQPLRTHPNDLLDAHPAEQYGCTVCHQGQGREVRTAAAHGNVPHWEEPLLEGELVYTSCGRCHAEGALFGHEAELFGASVSVGEIASADLTATIPGAVALRRGKHLFATKGCLGCHEYRGRGGSLGPELTHAGDKGLHDYDYGNLPPDVDHTPLAWLRWHFMDPGAMSPGTVMPGIGSSVEDANALSAYMLSLKSQDVPAAYRPAPRTTGGEPLDGRELYELFCVSCHGVDLRGGDVPEISTPSLANEDFLALADREYLTTMIRDGRSGTEMPAWHADAGGLTEAQIARLVDFVLSYTPDRADTGRISRLDGNPVYGRALYRGYCATCHGVDGEGGIGTRLNSTEFLSMASDGFLVDTILDGRPGTGMPAWRDLAAEEISDLLAYIRGWVEPGADIAAAAARVAAGEADAAFGARVFRARCAACHGDDGEGGIGPSVNHPALLGNVSDGYLARAIVDGRPGTAMPAWHDLDERDVADLVGHLRTLAPVPYTEPEDPVLEGDSEHGAILFQRSCSSCHGEDAVGGSGPQLRNPVFLATATDAFLYRTIEAGRPGTAMRAFGGGGIVDYSPSQIAAIVAWLRSLEYADPSDVARRSVLGVVVRGREIYEGEAGCASCHGFRGEGGVGPALGNPHFLRTADEGFLLGTMVLGRAHTEMRRFGTGGIADLSTEQLTDVAAYVRTLGDLPPADRSTWRPYAVTDDQIEVGRGLYAKYCGSCHGLNGRGGEAPELNNPELLRAASDGFFVATIARGRRGTPMRAFGSGPASMADLTHGEIRAIVGFLRSWERRPGGGRSTPALTAGTASTTTH